jgi:tRNA pseudouridine38-40 synthase
VQRFFIQLSYNGTAYHGWQVQENTAITVQEELNSKLTLILGEKIETTGCGRTDTGVHAKDFYAHFDVSVLSLPPDKLVHKLNSVLPNDIVVSRIFEVHNDANARFDALSRTYEYVISKKRNPFLLNAAYVVYNIPDIDKMNEAAATLLQFRDFSAFSKSNTQTLTNICRITEASWKEQGDLMIFTITADRFLRNMVRAIVGTLLEVGTGKISLQQFKEVIESKDRKQAGFSVPACGLYLTKVLYKEEN